MDDSPDDTSHFCPGCGARQAHFQRYPWYFCRDCLARATDAEGHALVFGNVSPSGGLSWAYRANPDMRDESALRVICLIGGRPVLVREARFGGVVAEPLTDDSRQAADRYLADLSRTGALERSRARINPASKRNPRR